jgi:hypothetical protein
LWDNFTNRKSYTLWWHESEDTWLLEAFTWGAYKVSKRINSCTQ